MKPKIDHLQYKVVDVRQARRLFSELLRLPLAWDFSDDPCQPACGVFFGNINVEFVSSTAMDTLAGVAEPYSGGPSFSLSLSAPVDETADLLKSQGLVFLPGERTVHFETLVEAQGSSEGRLSIYESLVDMSGWRAQLASDFSAAGGGLLEMECVESLELEAVSSESIRGVLDAFMQPTGGGAMVAYDLNPAIKFFDSNSRAGDRMILRVRSVSVAFEALKKSENEFRFDVERGEFSCLGIHFRLLGGQ